MSLHASPTKTTQPEPVPYSGKSGEPYIVPLFEKSVSPKQQRAWQVQVPIPQHLRKPGRGPVLTRAFRVDGGDVDAALSAARRWRDTVHSRLHGAPVPARTVHTRRANSKTGVPGVRFVLKKVRSRHAGGRAEGVVYEVPVFIAEVWTIPGVDGQRCRGSRSKLFSVSKWGEEEAFRLACEWRLWAQERIQRGELL